MKAYTPKDLASRTIARRAVEAVIWGMPAVNYELMYQAALRIKATFNQIVYWSRLPDWKNQTLTPNPDSIYLMPFINTKDAGPIVLEIPPAGEGVINGSVMDCWQTPLEDVGPAGVDKGAGGKYLILPPSHTGTPPPGYIPLPSLTYQGYALLRSILKSGGAEDVAKAVTYARRIKLYPLAGAVAPPATAFIDAVDAVFARRRQPKPTRGSSLATRPCSLSHSFRALTGRCPPCPGSCSGWRASRNFRRGRGPRASPSTRSWRSSCPRREEGHDRRVRQRVAGGSTRRDWHE